jgi:hypothetical protein
MKERLEKNLSLDAFFDYLVSGVYIRSPFKLEAPLEQKRSDGDQVQVVDISIGAGTSLSEQDVNSLSGRACKSLDEDGALFIWPNEATYHVENGNRVLISPHCAPRHSLWELSLLGPIHCALLHQRGHFPLHGCTVEKDGKAYVFLAHSTIGKSTLAANLCHRGYGFLGDDIALIKEDSEGRWLAYPSTPTLKLDREWVKALGWSGVTLSDAYPAISKLRVDMRSVYRAEPLFIGGIFILEENSQLSLSSRLSAADAYIEILRYTHTVRWLSAGGMAMKHMDYGRALQSTVPIFKLQYPKRLDIYDRVLDALDEVFSDSRVSYEGYR